MSDEVRFGPRREPRRRSLPGWSLAALAVAAVAVTLIVTHHGHRRPPRRPGLLAPVRVVGHRLLGVTARWRLLAYGPDGLIQIQPAAGRITRTAVPILASDGPVTFLAGPSQAIIRPWDGVPGYLVPDGHPARPLTGLLAGGDLIVPGPRPGQAWVQAGFGARSMSLAWLDGRRAGPVLRLPKGTPWLPAPDGRGYPLVTRNTALTLVVYDLSPAGARRVPGFVVATGPDRWLLARHCDHFTRCSSLVVNAATGARHALPGRLGLVLFNQPGVISPDGTTAAVLEEHDNVFTLHLINLGTGAQRQVSVALDNASSRSQTLAWSPDSRWLFVVAARGRLVAVSPATGRVQGLGATLPPVGQIAVQG